jgi:hypothetical protein
MRFGKSVAQHRLFHWQLMALLVAAGCGGASAAVSSLTGAVTLDGQPLPANAIATVSFHPVDVALGPPTSAQIVDGRYQCDKIPRGKVIAEVFIALPTGRTRATGRGQDEPEVKDVALVAEQADGIEVDVTGNATVDFDLRRAKQ